MSEHFLVFSATTATRAHGAGVVKVDKFYGTTANPLFNEDKFELRTAEVRLPDNMLGGLHHQAAPVVVNKQTGNIAFVVLPTHNDDGFYRPSPE